MKIRRKLNITSNDFYDYLENQVIQNFYEYSSTDLKCKDITKGLKININKKDKTPFKSFEILQYERGSCYEAKIKTFSDTITILYETQEEHDGLYVTFTQLIQSFEEKQSNRFFRMFSEIIYLGRMSDTLYNIQKNIHNKTNK